MNTFLTTATHYSAVVTKTKRLLVRSAAGVNGIRSLSRALGIAEDCGGTSTVSKAAFTAALAANEVSLTEKDVETVFAALDRAGSGTIDPADFIAAMRCDLSPLRQAWLRRAWLLFARKDPQGCVSVEDLTSSFRAEGHPEVVQGTRSAAQVADEFTSTFNRTTNPDGAVSLQEFEQYYAGVSAAYCDDEGFTAMLRGVWPMSGVCAAFTRSLASGACTINKTFSARQTAAEKKDVSLVKGQQAEMMRVVTQDHRPQVMESGLALRQLSRSLREYCADPSTGMFIRAEDFAATLAENRLYIAQPDAVVALDTNGDGSVDVLYYLALLIPAIPPARRLMLERLWQRVFPVKDESYRVEVKQFQSKYMAEDGQRRDAFLSAWDVRTAIAGKVSLDEFAEWCAPQSAKVLLDKEYEGLLGREWKGFDAEAEV